MQPIAPLFQCERRCSRFVEIVGFFLKPDQSLSPKMECPTFVGGAGRELQASTVHKLSALKLRTRHECARREGFSMTCEKMVVCAVLSELVSALFPDLQGKYREILLNLAETASKHTENAEYPYDLARYSLLAETGNTHHFAGTILGRTGRVPLP